MTDRQQLWFERLSRVKPGLRLCELASRLGEPYATVQRWAAFFGYPIRDGRAERRSRIDWSRVNWKLSNAEIARKLGVTRERVRQVRKQQVALARKPKKARPPAKPARRTTKACRPK